MWPDDPFGYFSIEISGLLIRLNNFLCLQVSSVVPVVWIAQSVVYAVLGLIPLEKMTVPLHGCRPSHYDEKLCCCTVT